MAGSDDGSAWKWKAPNLKPSGEWHTTARVVSLNAAVQGLPNEYEQWTR
jgi:hypothetical protein